MGRVNRAFPNTFYYCYLSWNTQRESLRRRVYRSGEAFTSSQPGNSLHATLNRDYLGSVSIDDWGVTGQLKRYMVLLWLESFLFQESDGAATRRNVWRKAFVTVFSFCPVHIASHARVFGRARFSSLPTKRAPLKTPAWEATVYSEEWELRRAFF